MRDCARAKNLWAQIHTTEFGHDLREMIAAELKPGMAVLARQQVIGLVIQLPTGLFVCNTLTLILGATEQQVLGLGQARHLASVILYDRVVGRVRQQKVAAQQIFCTVCTAKTHPWQVGEVCQRTGRQ
ncbi:hypothetical protein D3C80_1759450 [compost metagenome]